MDATIESREEVESEKPDGSLNYWKKELEASEKRLKKWHKKGNRVINRYLDLSGEDRIGGVDEDSDKGRQKFSMNLFFSNITTLNSLLYGNLPQIDVSRKFADANDDIARVAAEMMERSLNNDISERSDEIDSVLRGALQDRLLPGLGVAKVRYEYEAEMVVETVAVKNEAGETVYQDQETEQLTYEAAPVDYFHWRDILWGWGRSFSELPWIAYRTYMSKDAATERFGEEIANTLEYKQVTVQDNEEDNQIDQDLNSNWQKAEIWEIWDKEKRKVHWIGKGAVKVLETQEDPLGLKGFYPSPPFFIANATTSLYIPTPDYHLAKDLYIEVDTLQTRIAILTEAVKAVGVYDVSAEGVQRMFNEGFDNQLIPVDNWALFAERGGISGAIDWFPIKDIVESLDKLRQLRDDTIRLLQQTTGMSDLMQGGLNNAYEGVGQSELKARFGSVRIQKLQDEFASFASGLMQLKAEVISKHFDEATILKMSNMGMSFDREMVPQALKLIKSEEMPLRVVIRPESVAMTDFAELQSERTGYLTALSTFMQSAAPLIQSDPSAKPFLLQLLQWGLSGFKGSSEIEGVLDRAIEASQQQAKQSDKPSDAELAMQGELSKIQAKAAADMKLREQDAILDQQTAMHEHRMKMQEIMAQTESKLAEISAKLEADLVTEEAQTQANVMQAQAQVAGEIEKDQIAARTEVVVDAEKTRHKIAEIQANAGSKIAEMTVNDTLTKENKGEETKGD